MKVILILVVLVLVAATFGWLTFNNNDGRVSAELDSTEMKQDVQQAVDTVKEKTKEGIGEINSKINQ